MSIVREAFVTSVTWTPPSGPPVSCQVEPRIDRAEQQVAPFRGGSMARLVQDPGELEGGRIRGDRQPGRGSEAVRARAGGIRGRQRRTGLRGPGVLPDDRVVDRAPGPAIPHDGRLALVADPDRDEVPRGRARLAHRLPHARSDPLDDLGRVVFHPARAAA